MLEANVKVTGESQQLLAYALFAAAMQIAGNTRNGWCDVGEGGRMTFAVGTHPVTFGAEMRGAIQDTTPPLQAVSGLEPVLRSVDIPKFLQGPLPTPEPRPAYGPGSEDYERHGGL